jgi:hypothetical protein
MSRLAGCEVQAVYKVFTCPFEGVIKFRSVIDGTLYSALGAACLSEASFSPQNIKFQISCPEFITPSRTRKDFINCLHFAACKE